MNAAKRTSLHWITAWNAACDSAADAKRRRRSGAIPMEPIRSHKTAITRPDIQPGLYTT
jgi:hypothetical protein